MFISVGLCGRKSTKFSGCFLSTRLSRVIISTQMMMAIDIQQVAEEDHLPLKYFSFTSTFLTSYFLTFILSLPLTLLDSSHSTVWDVILSLTSWWDQRHTQSKSKKKKKKDHRGVKRSDEVRGQHVKQEGIKNKDICHFSWSISFLSFLETKNFRLNFFHRLLILSVHLVVLSFLAL